MWQSGLRHPSRKGLWIRNTFFLLDLPAAQRNPRCHTVVKNDNTEKSVSWNGDPMKEGQNGLTALSAATFFTLLAQGRLVDKDTSKDIEALLKQACSGLPFPESEIRATKCGQVGNVLHAAALIKKDGRLYVLVVLTKAAVWSDTTRGQFMRDLHQLMVKNP